MKRLFLYAAFAIGVLSCNSGGDANNQSAADTLAPTSMGEGGTGTDTTGLNVGAAQPIDSSNTLRQPMDTEPGANRSHLDSNTAAGRGTNGGGQ